MTGMRLYCIDSNTTLGGHRGLLERLKKNHLPGSKHIFIVPDRYTLGVEKEICESCFPDGTFSVDTFSFTRLAIKGLGNVALDCLTKEGTVLLLHRVIGECNDRLVYYKNIRSVGFARELFAAIASLRSGGITPDAIREKLPDFEKGTADKLADIALLYEEYEKALVGRLDTVTRVELLEERLAEIPWIAESHVYVLGFNVYSDLQIRLIKKMLLVCPSVSISFCRGMGGSNVFCFPSDQRSLLIDWCKEKGVPVLYERTEEQLLEPFKTLHKEMFGFGEPKDVFTPEQKQKVRVFSAENPYEEVKCACREIRQLVFSSGYRYKDIAVSCNDENYLPVLRTIFARFGIPCFTDEKFPVKRSFAARFLFSALQAICSEYALSDVIECIRSPLSGISFEEVRVLENYCIKYNVSYSGLLSPFTYGECEEAESVRQKAISVLNRVPRSGRIEDYCDFMTSVACSPEMEKIKEEHTEGASNALLAYMDTEGFLSVAEEIKKLCAGMEMTPAAFAELLSSTLEGMSISLLPQYIDCVFIGNTSDSRFSDVKALFVLGANDGNFPVQTADPLIISCFDSEIMRQNGLHVYPAPAEANLFEKFAVIDLCSKPERLYVGYGRSGFSGEKKEPGEGVKEILRRLFIKEKPLFTYYDFTDEERLLYILSCPENAYYEYVSGKIPPAYADAVKGYLTAKGYDLEEVKRDDRCRPLDGYRKEGDGYGISVTTLEHYFRCPYYHFLNDVLKVRPKEEGQLQLNEKGSLVHAVLEDYFRTNVRDLKTATDIPARISNSINKIFSRAEYVRFFVDAVSAYEMNGLKKECAEVLKALTENAINSQFVPTYFEVRFGQKEKIKLTVNGENFYFSGVIDRADVSGKDIVIIDYKTGAIEPEYEKIFDGEKIQLYVYLKHFLDKGYSPAGTFYQPIHGGYSAKGRSYAMQGQMRSDADTYLRLDQRMKSPEDGTFESDTVFFPCNYKNGEISFPRNKKYLLREDDFRTISDYVFRAAEQAISDIQNGDIDKNPIEGKCEYCPYVKMCGEQTERKRPSITIEDFGKGEEDGI